MPERIYRTRVHTPQVAITARVDQEQRFTRSDEFTYLRVHCRACGRSYAPEIAKVLIKDSKIDIIREIINRFHKHDKARGFECAERFDGTVEGIEASDA